MSQIKVAESTLGSNYELQIAEMSGGHITFPSNYMNLLSQILVLGMADYAKKLRNKEQAVAVAIDDEAGTILFWLKLEFMEGSKDDPDGSWNPSWGFDAKELGDNVTVYRTSNNTDLYQFTTNRAAAYRIQFTDPIQIGTAYRCFAIVLRNWLDTNSKADEEVSIIEEDYFKATVSIVNDEKVFTFSSEEELTNIMKGDSSLQVNP